MGDILWHIEPTSKCILECPLCDRTWFYKNFKKRELHEINIDDLIKFLDHKPYKISMCGNNGDPIYHSQFHELCDRLKKIGCELRITTNGSKKNKEWWIKLANILDKNDTLIFSIDGLEDTNKIYRIGSNFESIINGFKCVKGKVKTTWKFIPFKHNQHQIEDAKKLSHELGFDHFWIEKSERWWETELMPDHEFVNSDYRHQNKVKNNDQLVDPKILPRCIRNDNPIKGLYIDAAGDFYACCWTGLYSYRHKEIFDPRKKKYNIKNNTINSILNDGDVKTFFTNVKDYDSAPKCCKIYCGLSND